MSAPAESRGTTLGRFLVLDRIGEGGMGVVYRAYDPDLDRRVAIKVLRPPDELPFADEAAARLRREAQAMAKISHPNVVPVYEVGTRDDGHVFLVMEYVPGGTLAAWQTGRDEPEVLAAYLAAGRGLAAAHAAGIVHRDFKPENVLVAPDGRFLVGDFGLVGFGARVEGTARTDPGGVELTRSHALLGTPRYMAPEQHRHEPATERSDQFAFAVSLWTALAGEPPFAGDTYRELVGNVLDGKRREPPRDRMSARVRRVLERALSIDPAARYPDVAAMLDALAPPRRQRAGVAVAGTAAALAALGAWAVIAREEPAPEPARCTGAPALAAEVWDPARATRLRAAFAATGVARAPAIADAAVARLDAYAAVWIDGHREACEATRLRGEQSEAVLDLRMTCLDRRLRELDALAGLLEGATADQIDATMQAALKLTPVAACADVAALSAPVPPPTDPAVRVRVDALAARVAQVKALSDAGRYAEAAELGRALRPEATELGYRPLHAELLLLLAGAQSQAGDPAAARASLDDAVYHAEASGHDHVAARAWSTQAFVAGFLLGDVPAGEAAARRADAAILRIGDPGEPRGRLELNLGALSYGQGKNPDAIAHWERALALWTAALGDGDPELARILNNLGAVYGDVGRDADAIAALRRAVAIWSGSIGDRHPLTARVRLNLGLQLRSHGAIADSIRELEGATAVLEEILGPEHAETTTALQALATSYLEHGRHDDAWRTISRVAAAREAAGGIPAVTLLVMSSVRLGQGELAEARRLATDALAKIPDEPPGPARADPGQAHVILAEVALAERAWPTARREAARALEHLERAFGAEARTLAPPLLVTAEVALATGDPAAAEAPLARAIALTERDDPLVFARASRVLAEQRWQLGRADDARAAAARGRDALAEAGLGDGTAGDALAAWLAAHP
jgi:tetratricopeptide (TPR) repeat protein